MANTKNLDREERKQVKRVQRLKLKALYASMTPEDRKKYEQLKESKPGLGIKAFMLGAKK